MFLEFWADFPLSIEAICFLILQSVKARVIVSLTYIFLFVLRNDMRLSSANYQSVNHKSFRVGSFLMFYFVIKH